MENITIENYFKESYAVWADISLNPLFSSVEMIKPDGSKSYYGQITINNEVYILRKSDHWGKVKNCQWYLSGHYNLNYDCIVCDRMITAICKLSDFRSIGENPYKDFDYEFFVE